MGELSCPNCGRLVDVEDTEEVGEYCVEERCPHCDKVSCFTCEHTYEGNATTEEMENLLRLYSQNSEVLRKANSAPHEKQ